MTQPSPMAWPAALESREAKLEPFEWYRRSLADGPVRYDDERDCWDVFGYDAVDEVLTDAETYSSVTAPESERGALPSMLSADPPKHTALREPVEEYFQPGAVRSLEPDVRETARRLLREADDGDGVLDVVDDLAWSLPIHTIAALLGVPAEDRQQFKEWSDAVVAGPTATDGDLDELELQRSEAAMALAEYFAEICARRREEPSDDLVSKVLLETELSDTEVLGLFRLLLIAGNVTTTNLIGNAVWCLADHGLVDEVRGDPGRIDDALEETLRYRSSVQRTVRRATRETELCGHRIEPDDRLAVWLGAANRDPTRFEAPGEFALDLSPNAHVAFGRGIHVCLGAPLAKLEGRVALETLFARYGAVERVEAELEPFASPFIYGVQGLPVAVEPEAGAGAGASGD